MGCESSKSVVVVDAEVAGTMGGVPILGQGNPSARSEVPLANVVPDPSLHQIIMKAFYEGGLSVCSSESVEASLSLPVPINGLPGGRLPANHPVWLDVLLPLLSSLAESCNQEITSFRLDFPQELPQCSSTNPAIDMEKLRGFRGFLECKEEDGEEKLHTLVITSDLPIEDLIQGKIKPDSNLARWVIQRARNMNESGFKVGSVAVRVRQDHPLLVPNYTQQPVQPVEEKVEEEDEEACPLDDANVHGVDENNWVQQDENDGVSAFEPQQNTNEITAPSASWTLSTNENHENHEFTDDNSALGPQDSGAAVPSNEDLYEGVNEIINENINEAGYIYEYENEHINESINEVGENQNETVNESKNEGVMENIHAKRFMEYLHASNLPESENVQDSPWHESEIEDTMEKNHERENEVLMQDLHVDNLHENMDAGMNEKIDTLPAEASVEVHEDERIETYVGSEALLVHGLVGGPRQVHPDSIARRLAVVNAWNPTIHERYSKHSNSLSCAGVGTVKSSRSVMLGKGLGRSLVSFFRLVQRIQDDGETYKVETLLETVAGISREELHLRSGFNGLTALGAAVSARVDLAVIKELVNKGSPILGRAAGGWASPLRIVASRGDVGMFVVIVEQAIAAQTDDQKLDWNDVLKVKNDVSELWMPIVAAFEHYQFEFVHAMLPNMTSDTKKDVWAWLDRIQCQRALRNHCVNSSSDNDNNTRWMTELRIETENEMLVDELPSGTIFHECTEEDASQLLEFKQVSHHLVARYDVAGWTALHIAAARGQTEKCKSLARHSPQLLFMQRENRPLCSLVRQKHKLGRLLTSPKPPSKLPLYVALSQRKLNTAEVLLAAMNQVEPLWAKKYTDAAKAILDIAVQSKLSEPILNDLLRTVQRGGIVPDTETILAAFRAKQLKGIKALRAVFGESIVSLAVRDESSGATPLTVALRSGASPQVIREVLRDLSQLDASPCEILRAALLGHCAAETVCLLLDELQARSSLLNSDEQNAIVRDALKYCADPLPVLQRLDCDNVDADTIATYLHSPCASDLRHEVLNKLLTSIRQCLQRLVQPDPEAEVGNPYFIRKMGSPLLLGTQVRGGAETLVYLANKLLEQGGDHTVAAGLAVVAWHKDCQPLMAAVYRHFIERQSEGPFGGNFLRWAKVTLAAGLKVPFIGAVRRTNPVCSTAQLLLMARDRNYVNHMMEEFGPTWFEGSKRQPRHSPIAQAARLGLDGLVRLLVVEYEVKVFPCTIVETLIGAFWNPPERESVFESLFWFLVDQCKSALDVSPGLWASLTPLLLYNVTFGVRALFQLRGPTPVVPPELIVRMLGDPHCRGDVTALIKHGGVVPCLQRMFEFLADLRIRPQVRHKLNTSLEDMVTVKRVAGIQEDVMLTLFKAAFDPIKWGSCKMFIGMDRVAHAKRFWRCAKWLYQNHSAFDAPTGDRFVPTWLRVDRLLSDVAADDETIASFLQVHETSLTSLSVTGAGHALEQVFANPNLSSCAYNKVFDAVLLTLRRAPVAERNAVLTKCVCFVLQSGMDQKHRHVVLKWVVDRVLCPTFDDYFACELSRACVVPLAFSSDLLHVFPRPQWKQIDPSSPLGHTCIRAALAADKSKAVMSFLPRALAQGNYQPSFAYELLQIMSTRRVVDPVVLRFLLSDSTLTSKISPAKLFVEAVSTALVMGSSQLISALASIRRDGSNLELEKSINREYGESALQDLKTASYTLYPSQQQKGQNAAAVSDLDSAWRASPEIGHCLSVSQARFFSATKKVRKLERMKMLFKSGTFDRPALTASWSVQSLEWQVNFVLDVFAALKNIVVFGHDGPAVWFSVVGEMMISIESRMSQMIAHEMFEEASSESSANAQAMVRYCTFVSNEGCLLVHRRHPLFGAFPRFAHILSPVLRDPMSFLGRTDVLGTLALDLRVSPHIRALALNILGERGHLETGLGRFGLRWTIPLALLTGNTAILDAIAESQDKLHVAFAPYVNHEDISWGHAAALKYQGKLPGLPEAPHSVDEALLRFRKKKARRDKRPPWQDVIESC